MVGCVDAEDGKSEAIASSAMNQQAINIDNIDEYIFDGICPEDGVDNLEYTLSGMGKDPLEGTLSCVNNKWEFPVPELELRAFEDGEMTLIIVLSDLSITINVVKDTVAPILNSISQQVDGFWAWECAVVDPCDDYRTFINNSANYEFPDSAPFLDITRIKIPVDWRSNGDQDFYVHVQAQDDAGNLSVVTTSENFRFDNILPGLTSLIISDDTWSWSCSEVNCEYRFVIDNSALSPASIEQSYVPINSITPDSGPGTYYIHVQVRDPFGNKSSIVSTDVPIVITSPDTIPPQESGVSAVTGSYKRGDEIILSVIFHGPVIVRGAPRLQIVIGEDASDSERDSAIFAGNSDISTTTVDFIYTAKADHHGRIIATSFIMDAGDKIEDEAGNFSTAIFDRNFIVEGVNIDTIIPVLSGLTNDTMPTNSKTWSWGCSEDNCSYRFIVNNDETFSFTGQPYAAIDTMTENSGNGTRYLHVQARDAAGNESPVVSVSVIIDSRPPTVDIIAGNNFWSWICSDNYSCNYRFAVSEQRSYSFSASDAYNAVTSAVSGSSSTGPYYVYVQAKDAAGNESSVVKSTTALPALDEDVTPPEVVGINSEIGAYGVGENIYITVNFSEPVAFTSPNITLRIAVGGINRNILFVGNPEELNIAHQFLYRIRSGENSSIVATSIAVDSMNNAIQDASGNNVIADFMDRAIADVIIDGIEPNIFLDNDGVDWVWSL